MIGGLTPFVAQWTTSFVNPSQTLLLFMAWPATMMLLIAVGEWLFREGDQWRTLAWATACCLAAAGWNTLVYFFFAP